MELHEVDVYIDAKGTVNIEVRGIKGGSCRDVTAALEAALGNQVLSRDATAEADETSAVLTERVQVGSS